MPEVLGPQLGGLTRLKAGFFDREAVTNASDRASRRALSRFGAYVRTRARSSIRSRKAASTPGNPPSSHSGLLKRWILFSYDRRTRSVVVGPLVLNQVQTRGPSFGAGRVGVPEALEDGGPVSVLEIFRHGRWQRADLRSRRRIAEYQQRFRTVRIAPRPYMRPAETAERSKLPAMLANAAA